MKNLLTISIVILIIFNSCKKDEECEISNLGTLCVSNQTDGIASVWIDDVFKFNVDNVTGQKCLDLSSGVHILSAVSHDFTTNWEENIEIIKCKKTSFNLTP